MITLMWKIEEQHIGKSQRSIHTRKHTLSPLYVLSIYVLSIKEVTCPTE
jgi:hypothetical protein